MWCPLTSPWWAWFPLGSWPPPSDRASFHTVWFIPVVPPGWLLYALFSQMMGVLVPQPQHLLGVFLSLGLMSQWVLWDFLSSIGSFNIGDRETYPLQLVSLSGLGHSSAGSDPVVIVVESVTRGRLGSNDDTFSLPKVWHCSNFSVASHLEPLGSDSKVPIPCLACSNHLSCSIPHFTLQL